MKKIILWGIIGILLIGVTVGITLSLVQEESSFQKHISKDGVVRSLGGFDLTLYLSKHPLNSSQCSSLKDVPTGEVLDFMKAYPETSKRILLTERRCTAKKMASIITTDRSYAIEKFWRSYALDIALSEEQTLLKDECIALCYLRDPYNIEDFEKKTKKTLLKNLEFCKKHYIKELPLDGIGIILALEDIKK
ncbi:MAG TPA: hypothetical protein ENK66_10170 [Arcobacter sp.]|nr:hypothetical protein [Arcobacter sp.]